MKSRQVKEIELPSEFCEYWQTQGATRFYNLGSKPRCRTDIYAEMSPDIIGLGRNDVVSSIVVAIKQPNGLIMYRVKWMGELLSEKEMLGYVRNTAFQ